VRKAGAAGTDSVKRTAAVGVAAETRNGESGLGKFVVTHVNVHVAQADDAVAHGALRCTAAVLDLVRGKARELHLGRGDAVAALGDFEVAETAKDEFGGTVSCSVSGEFGEV
jgi:hypothetical protein